MYWTCNDLCDNKLIQSRFLRYLDVFTTHSGVSFPLIMLIYVTGIVYKK